MEENKFEELKKEAWDAGENDTVTEGNLIEGAQLWLDDKESEELTDDERNELIESYRQGFLGNAVGNDRYFNCLRLHRDDFTSRGFNADDLTDEEMQSIADHIGEGAMESFWCSVEWHGDDRKLPVIDIENE